MSENPLYAHLLSQGYIGGIGKPDFEVFKNISFNLGYGFFGTSPFMWLGFLAIPYVLITGHGTQREQDQRRTAAIGWMLTMLVLWTTVSAAINWRGGWTIGPRYLGAAPPFFAYGALCAFEAISGRSPLRRAIMRGVAGGAALASFFSIGFVGLHFNTIPEDVVRPLAQFSWPLALAGFVPHHALELFGVKSPAFWYVVAGCGAGATCLAALVPWQEKRGTWGVRVAVFAAVFGATMLMALVTPSEEERGDFGEHMRHSFADGWQPAGRDELTTLRVEAERFGPRRPCNWIRLAGLEQLLGMRAEAARDEAKGGTPPVQCNGPIDRLDRFAVPPKRVTERAGPAPRPPFIRR
jgi:hypothetical protein